MCHPFPSPVLLSVDFNVRPFCFLSVFSAPSLSVLTLASVSSLPFFLSLFIFSRMPLVQPPLLCSNFHSGFKLFFNFWDRRSSLRCCCDAPSHLPHNAASFAQKLAPAGANHLRSIGRVRIVVLAGEK
jgi:hypothetical protein